VTLVHFAWFRGKTTSPETEMTNPASQTETFKQAARELGCDEDDGRWGERLREVATQRVPERPE
jgi:hypothetical protein